MFHYSVSKVPLLTTLAISHDAKAVASKKPANIYNLVRPLPVSKGFLTVRYKSQQSAELRANESRVVNKNQ